MISMYFRQAVVKLQDMDGGYGDKLLRFFKLLSVAYIKA